VVLVRVSSLLAFAILVNAAPSGAALPDGFDFVVVW
jgi:hypothetical protein